MSTSSSPVIVAATPLTGHTQPLLTLSRGLADAGHPVTFLGGSRFAAAASATGAQFVPLGGVADYDDRTLAEDRPERMATEPGLPRVAWEVAHLFADAIPDQNAALQALLESTPEAVLLHDLLFLGAWPQLLGAPGRRARRTISVGVTPLMFPDPTTTAFGPVPVPPGADQRAATAAANAHVEAALASGQDHLSQVLRGLGATEPVPFILAGTSTVPDVHAQLTVASFEFPRSELPDSVEFVGPLLPAPATGWVAPDWWAELDGATVVTVTQGTVANDDLSELIQPTLDALADQDVMVIAALGRDRAGTGLRVPANARVEAFVPFSELLPRSSVLITNGGYGATQQALAHGVPILVAGLTEDKAMVAARIGAFGVGIDLNTQRPEPDAIARACAELLSDPEYRTRARAIGADIAASDAQAAVAALLA